jgi:hypothetical protein
MAALARARIAGKGWLLLFLLGSGLVLKVSIKLFTIFSKSLFSVLIFKVYFINEMTLRRWIKIWIASE